MALHVRLDSTRHIWETAGNEKENVFHDLLEHHPREVEFGKWIEFKAYADARVIDTWNESLSRTRRRRVFVDDDTVRSIRRSRSIVESWGPCQIDTLPPVAPSGTYRLFFDKISQTLMYSSNGSAWTGVGAAFERGGVLVNSNGITAAINIIAWRAPYACIVMNVKGYRVGGTGATVNARKNGSSTHLSSALSLSSADTWMDGGSVQNATYAAGDKLEIMLVSVTGSPTQVGIQVDFAKT